MGAADAAAHKPRPQRTFGQRLRAFLRPPRRLKFTREGRYFFFISLAIGFAAVNTGNNLLYLLLGMTLSLIVASGILSEQVLRKLEVRREVPGEIFAERPFLVGVELRNTKKRVPSYSIEIEDIVGGQALERKCYFLKIPPARAQHTSYRFAFTTRGRHRFERVRLSTKFPFALFRKSREVDLEEEVIVYPAKVDVTDLVRGARAGLGESATGRVGAGEDFWGIREWRDGEDQRAVHWKTSARAGRLMVREAEAASSRRLAIFVDNACPEPDPTRVAEIERAIARAASLATHFIERGYRVRVVTRAAQVPEGAGRGHLRAILKMLALLEIDLSGRAEPMRMVPGTPTIIATAGSARRPTQENPN